MNQLSFVPMPYGIFTWRDSWSGSGFLQVRTQDGCDLGDGGALVTVEVAHFDVEITVIVEAISGNGGARDIVTAIRDLARAVVEEGTAVLAIHCKEMKSEVRLAWWVVLSTPSARQHPTC